MAAGLGFKDFVTGEVLTAADVDGYLMQGVWVFASAAARDAAVTSPQEGHFAYLKDTNVTTYYTGSAWANLDTTGMTNPMTTTGDTIYSSSGSTPARLGIGSTGNVLTVSGGVPVWAAPAGGGKVLQVIMGQNSTVTNLATTTYSDINLSASITPSSASSKVLVMVTQSVIVNRSDASNWANWRLMRDSTAVYNDSSAGRAAAFWGINTISSQQMGTLYCGSYLDSPATTSATTYKTQWKSHTTASSASIDINSESGTSSTIILMEIGA